MNRNDFITIQKIMEIYAKSLLYNIRIKHQEERIAYLESKSPKAYVQKIKEQMDLEIDSFI